MQEFVRPSNPVGWSVRLNLWMVCYVFSLIWWIDNVYQLEFRYALKIVLLSLLFLKPARLANRCRLWIMVRMLLQVLIFVGFSYNYAIVLTVNTMIIKKEQAKHPDDWPEDNDGRHRKLITAIRAFLAEHRNTTAIQTD